VAKASTNSTESNSRISLPPTKGGVVVDIGTGDGRYVCRSARSNPDRFYIGIDVERGALQKISEKIHRKPAKGGLSNVLFVHASVEAFPAELNDTADEIHIHFPWGSLLHSVVLGERRSLSALRRISAPGAWLEVLIGLDEARDAAEVRRLGLPSLTMVVPRYARAGFEAVEIGIIPRSEWPHLETTWARRLRGNDARRMLFLVAQARR
jgi:16S rRNA (adenine(1408)-N(1))-methyltransferase